MIIYILLMIIIAIFFYKEGKKVTQMDSVLLKDFCEDTTRAQHCARQLFLVAKCGLLSACLMALALAYGLLMDQDMPKLPVALSFLVYTFGFSVAIWRFYKDYKK